MDIRSKIKRNCEIVWNYLSVSDEPKKADVIFILGGSTLYPIAKAYELYKKEYAPIIAFISVGGTFGGQKTWNMPEADKYKEVLLQKGIPESAILSDKLSSNTLKEAQKLIPFLNQNGIDVESLILIARPVHQRRALATFIKQHPELNYINCPANEPFSPDDPILVKRLVQEIDRVQAYADKGDIERQEIPEEVLDATEKLRLIFDKN